MRVNRVRGVDSFFFILEATTEQAPDQINSMPIVLKRNRCKRVSLNRRLCIDLLLLIILCIELKAETEGIVHVWISISFLI